MVMARMFYVHEQVWLSLIVSPISGKVSLLSQTNESEYELRYRVAIFTNEMEEIYFFFPIRVSAGIEDPRNEPERTGTNCVLAHMEPLTPGSTRPICTHSRALIRKVVFEPVRH